MATVSPMVNLEHHGPAPEATDDPSSLVSRHIYVGLSYDVTVVWEMQLESVEAVRGVVGDEQVGGEILQLICPAQPARRGVCNRGPQLVAIDDDARHGAPQVAPPPGQRVRLHGLPRREEGHMIVWTRQSGNALRRSPSSSAFGWSSSSPVLVLSSQDRSQKMVELGCPGRRDATGMQSYAIRSNCM
uniref:Uncharacterized protein n=1 Tax=Oryza nivara TaxID=4536 RepID=A0A0E0IQX7_ORYNI